MVTKTIVILVPKSEILGIGVLFTR